MCVRVSIEMQLSIVLANCLLAVPSFAYGLMRKTVCKGVHNLATRHLFASAAALNVLSGANHCERGGSAEYEKQNPRELLKVALQQNQTVVFVVIQRVLYSLANRVFPLSCALSPPSKQDERRAEKSCNVVCCSALATKSMGMCSRATTFQVEGVYCVPALLCSLWCDS